MRNRHMREILGLRRVGDVDDRCSDPAQPKYLAHIPGLEGNYEDGGAQMVRVCDGKTLPKGDPNKTYMLRVFGGRGHEMWDVTDPAKPALLTKIIEGLKDTHKSWWECETGICARYLGCAGSVTSMIDVPTRRSPSISRIFRASKAITRTAERRWCGSAMARPCRKATRTRLICCTFSVAAATKCGTSPIRPSPHCSPRSSRASRTRIRAGGNAKPAYARDTWAAPGR